MASDEAGGARDESCLVRQGTRSLLQATVVSIRKRKCMGHQGGVEEELVDDFS
jgi:hypothetical protein